MLVEDARLSAANSRAVARAANLLVGASFVTFWKHEFVKAAGESPGAILERTSAARFTMCRRILGNATAMDHDHDSD